MVMLRSLLVALVATFAGARQLAQLPQTQLSCSGSSPGAPGAKLLIKAGPTLNNAKTLREIPLQSNFQNFNFFVPSGSIPNDGILFVQYVNGNDEPGNGPRLPVNPPTVDPPCGEKTVTLRARGYSNSEIVEVKVGSTTIGRVKLAAQFQEYTFKTTECTGDVTVNFVNDVDESTTVEVDYVRIVDGTNTSQRRASAPGIVNTGAFAAATGQCGTIVSSPIIACEGGINFGPI